MPPISGPKSFNVPICPVLPFAARRGSRQYADGQSKPGSNCSQTASVPLREGATQCRAKHCKERPVLDRGQALGVRFFRPNETRNKPATTILIPRRQTHALPRSSPRDARHQLALILFRRQELLIDFGYYHIIWVNHFSYVNRCYFGEQLVGVHF